MGKIFVGQHFLLTLLGSVDITGGSAVIQYRKPGSSVPAEIAATILDHATASCQAKFTPMINNAAGIWRFWLKLTFSDDTIGIGETFRQRVLPAGA